VGVISFTKYCAGEAAERIIRNSNILDCFVEPTGHKCNESNILPGMTATSIETPVTLINALTDVPDEPAMSFESPAILPNQPITHADKPATFQESPITLGTVSAMVASSIAAVRETTNAIANESDMATEIFNEEENTFSIASVLCAQADDQSIAVIVNWLKNSEKRPE
jgi:hypothetical protein